MRLRAVVLAGLVMGATTSFAWGDLGHQAIARLAWTTLGEKQGTLKQLLENLPRTDTPIDSFIAPYPFDPAPKAAIGVPNLFSATIEDAAVWPDKVRSTWLDRPSWHYVNHPIAMDGIVPPPLPEVNVETAIVRLVKLASDKSLAPTTRAACVAWLCHLVGDLHQPLHAVAWYDKDHPKGDRGGNDFFPKENSPLHDKSQAPINLHSYWDSGARLSDYGVDSIIDMSKTYDEKTPDFGMGEIEAQVKLWGEESERIARGYVYRTAGPNSHILSTNESRWYKGQKEYKDLAQKQCLMRFRKAGARLGRILALVLK